MSFVDTTNMSDLDVKRLGHHDDISSTTKRGTKRPAPVMVNASSVFTAAVTAHRINDGEYVKAGSGQYVENVGWVPNPKATNRTIIDQVLKGEISSLPEDQELAGKVQTHFKGLTFKILKGNILTEFDQKSLYLASADEISERDINVVACLPSAYERSTKRQSIDDRIANCEREHISSLGSKVDINGEVVRSVYSQQWACWFITMITQSNHAVFFSQKKGIEVGATIRIEGKVKAHRDGFQTQLNYVRVI